MARSKAGMRRVAERRAMHTEVQAMLQDAYATDPSLYKRIVSASDKITRGENDLPDMLRSIGYDNLIEKGLDNVAWAVFEVINPEGA